MAAAAGFEDDRIDDVFILLDKMDKIGLDGVRESLLEKGFSEAAVANYTGMFEKISGSMAVSEFCSEVCPDTLDEKVTANMDVIMQSVRKMIAPEIHIEFDPTLVRGMSYYTGTIFEVTIDGRTQTLGVGDSFIVPSNLVHGVKALEAGRLVDSFTPHRADFI